MLCGSLRWIEGVWRRGGGIKNKRGVAHPSCCYGVVVIIFLSKYYDRSLSVNNNFLGYVLEIGGTALVFRVSTNS